MSCISISPDDKTMIIGTWYKDITNIYKIDLDNFKIIWEGKIQEGQQSVKISPDGQYLAVGSYVWSDVEDSYIGTLSIYNYETMELISVLKSSKGYVYGLDFTNDSKYLAAAWDDGTAKVWDLDDLKNYREFVHNDNPDITMVKSVKFSNDGKYLISALQNFFYHTIKIWDLQTGELVKEFHIGMILGLYISPNDKYIIGSMKLNVYMVKTPWTTDVNNQIPEDETFFTVSYQKPVLTVELSQVLTQPAKLEIISIDGKIIADFNIDPLNKNTFEFNLSLPAGVYFCRITGESLNQTKKIMVE